METWLDIMHHRADLVADFLCNLVNAISHEEIAFKSIQKLPL